MIGTLVNLLRRPSPPGVIAPHGFSIALVKRGSVSSWVVFYVENSRPNFKKSFNISPGAKIATVEGKQFHIMWP